MSKSDLGALDQSTVARRPSPPPQPSVSASRDFRGVIGQRNRRWSELATPVKTPHQVAMPVAIAASSAMSPWALAMVVLHVAMPVPTAPSTPTVPATTEIKKLRWLHLPPDSRSSGHYRGPSILDTSSPLLSAAWKEGRLPCRREPSAIAAGRPPFPLQINCHTPRMRGALPPALLRCLLPRTTPERRGRCRLPRRATRPYSIREPGAPWPHRRRDSGPDGDGITT